MTRTDANGRRQTSDGERSYGRPFFRERGGPSKTFFARNCHENRMDGCSLMHPAHTANTRADLIFIHNGAPQALVGCQAAERRASSAAHPRFARATRGRSGVGGFPPLRVSAGEGDRSKDNCGGVGRRSDASAVAIARNTCRKTLKTWIQRPGPRPRPDPKSSPEMSEDASARTERPHPLIIIQQAQDEVMAARSGGCG